MRRTEAKTREKLHGAFLAHATVHLYHQHPNLTKNSAEQAREPFKEIPYEPPLQSNALRDS